MKLNSKDGENKEVDYEEWGQIPTSEAMNRIEEIERNLGGVHTTASLGAFRKKLRIKSRQREKMENNTVARNNKRKKEKTIWRKT